MPTYSYTTDQPVFFPTRDSSGNQLTGMIDYPAQYLRQAIRDLAGTASGVVNVGDFNVTLASATQVTVAAGRFRINGTDTTTQGLYVGGLSTPSTLDVQPCDTTRDRIDVVAIEIIDQDVQAGATGYSGQLTWVTGSYPTSGSPTVPSVPTSSIALAQVYITHGSSTNVTSGNITNVAVPVGPQVSSGRALIQQQILGANASTVTFSSIPSYFTHIEIDVWAAGTISSGNGVDVYPIFNSDTTSNYTSGQIWSNQNTAVNGGNTAVQSAPSANAICQINNSSSNISGFTIKFPYYSTPKPSTITTGGRDADCMSWNITGWNVHAMIWRHVWWHGAAAINRIDLTCASGGSWLSGSILRLYGII